MLSDGEFSDEKELLRFVSASGCAWPEPLAAAGMADGGGTLEALQAPQGGGGQPPLPDGPRFIVTYLEVAPASESQAITLMKTYRDATRKGEGNLKAEVLQRNARPGHFVITEQWRDEAAWKNHRQAGHSTHFQDMLKGLRVGPYDERNHAGLAGLAMGSAASTSGGAVLVVTHVDVIPPGQVQLREMLKTLAEASRKETGTPAVRRAAGSPAEPFHGARGLEGSARLRGARDGKPTRRCFAKSWAEGGRRGSL